MAATDHAPGADVAGARAAWQESNTRTDEIDLLIAESRAVVSEVADWRAQNHFADKIRARFQGVA